MVGAKLQEITCTLRLTNGNVDVLWFHSCRAFSCERGEDLDAISRDVPGCFVPDDPDHALLGIVGQHAQALPRIPLPAFLLGLRHRHGGRRDVLGTDGGQHGASGNAVSGRCRQTPVGPIFYAVAGGAIFNVANLLLVAAIDVAGLAVAFPVGIGLALVIGAVSNYVLKPEGNPLLLFGGVALVVVAIILDAAAYRKREATAKATTGRGIVISLACGVLMGCFYPFVAHALNGEPDMPAPGPYAITLFFTIGVLISAVPANWLLMKKPLDGKEPVDGAGYWRAPLGWHLAGTLGGAIWCDGRRREFSRVGRASGGAGGFL